MTDFNTFGSIPTQPTQGGQPQQPGGQGGNPFETNPFSAPINQGQAMGTTATSTENSVPQGTEQQVPQFANIIPESPTLSANATEKMMQSPNVGGVSADIATSPEQVQAKEEIPGQGQTYFTPQQPQEGNEPLREYAEPPKGISGKGIFAISIFCIVLGILIGVVFFNTPAPAPQNAGLQGVVKNPDITTPLKRCGQVEKGQACIFYIFNNTRYDRTVDSFFDEIVRLTEISKYSIAMVNAQYAKTLIRPGYIAEIKLPAQR